MSFATDLLQAKDTALTAYLTAVATDEKLYQDLAKRWGWRALVPQGLLSSPDTYTGGYIDKRGTGPDAGKWFVRFANVAFDGAAVYETREEALRAAVLTILNDLLSRI